MDPHSAAPDEALTRLQVVGMDCANCALTLERGVAQLSGVRTVQVNFATATLQAAGTATADEIAQRVRALGYDVVRDGAEGSSPARAVRRTGPEAVSFARYLVSDRRTLLIVAAGVMLGLDVILGLVWPGMPPVVSALLRLSAIAAAGHPIAIKGLRSLLVARQITIDLLMSIATAGALLIGETGEAATVILLFAIGEALEGFTAERARDSLRSLLDLSPPTATVVRPCMDCAEHLGTGGYEGGPCPFCAPHEAQVPVSEVGVGEMVIVRPGERIPVDGVVVAGQSGVNQAPITGESLPVARQPGDDVFAGTVNGEAALELRATRPSGDSTLSRIVRLVEQAQAQKSPVERFIDRFARWYTPAVVTAAILVATLPPLVFGLPFIDPANPTRGWLYRALALLIVACPCALVISTPVTVVSTLTSLMRRGILVKGGVFLDLLAQVRVFAFDKTGTLTAGHPQVVQMRTPDCQDDHAACDACNDLLALAASVERRSEHPIARAIVAEAAARALDARYTAAQVVESMAGRGVRGRLNGSEVVVGSHAMFHETRQDCQGFHEAVRSAEAAGQTVVLVGRDGVLQGFISVADRVRPATAPALRSLKELNPSYRIIMLTGDNQTVASVIASEIGAIDEVFSGLLPGDKAGAVQSLEARHGRVAMVGDGINDAPALAQASVGIAMGGTGSDQAMETANVVLMQDDLSHLPDLLRTSSRAERIIRQNIAFSLAIKGLFLLLTLPGLATMWMAVFADMGASLLVTFNGMRMLARDRGRQ